MKHHREFEIAWQGLKEGVHEYEFLLDDRFMKEQDAPAEMHDWNATVKLKLDKKVNFFLLHFDIGGRLALPCDRCGDDFELKLWDEFNLVVKLSGDSEEDVESEDEDDVVFIPRSETVLEISSWLYEFVMLSLPLQRIHPDKEDGTPGCNPQALKLLNQLSEPEGDPEHGIWKGLEALKETNKNKRKTD